MSSYEIPQARLPQVHYETLGRTAVVCANILSGFGTDDLLDCLSAEEQERTLTASFTTPADANIAAPTEATTVRVDSFRSYKDGHVVESFEGYKDNRAARISLEGDLHKVRERLAGLDSRQQDILQSYCNFSPLDFLKKAKNATRNDGPVPRWSSWLAHEASDEQLVNFLQWHADSLERQQTNPAAEEAIETERQQYKQAIARAVKEGWLHEDAAAAAEKVDDIKVYIGDVFDTLMEERGGYHLRGTSEIIIASVAYPGYVELSEMDLLKNIAHATKHEFNHAILGVLNYRWLDEAVTEHIVQALEHGEPKIIDPAERENDKGTYKEERALLADILRGGSEFIPISLLTKAYSERPSGELRTVCLRAIARAWSHYSRTSLARLELYIRLHEDQYEQQGKSKAESRRHAIRDAHCNLWDYAAGPFSDKILHYATEHVIRGAKEVLQK